MTAIERQPPDLSGTAVLRRMLGLFRPYRQHLFMGLFMVVLTICLGVASPLLLARIIDDALPNHDLRLLGLLCGAMIVIGLVSSGLAAGSTVLTHWIGQRVTADLRVDVYDRVRDQPLEFFTGNGEAQVQGRLVSDVDGIDRFITTTVYTMVTAMTGLLVTAAVMLVLSWPIALASFVVAMSLSLMNHRFAGRRRELADERQRALTDMLHTVSENLSLPGVLLGRTLGRTETQRDWFVDICEQIRSATYRQRLVGLLLVTAMGAGFASFPPVIYLVAGTVFPDLSVGTVVVLVIMQLRLAGPLQSLLRHSGSVQASIAMCARVIQYLDLPSQAAEPRSVRVPSKLRTDTGPASICLQGVSYRYEGSSFRALREVDVDLSANSVNVVMGETGSGKSTLSLLLAGLIPVQEGAVVVDGEVTGPDRLREIVTLVPQHTTLLSGTIRDNLTFARADVADDELEAVIAVACLDEFLDAQPEGLDSRVGSNGYQLSGGERQRLAIARALLVPGRILVLDEATSAIDEPTAIRIITNLRRGCASRALVLVTHRRPELARGDRVVVMDKGRVVGQESHIRGRSGTDAGHVVGSSDADLRSTRSLTKGES